MIVSFHSDSDNVIAGSRHFFSPYFRNLIDKYLRRVTAILETLAQDALTDAYVTSLLARTARKKRVADSFEFISEYVNVTVAD